MNKVQIIPTQKKSLEKHKEKIKIRNMFLNEIDSTKSTVGWLVLYKSVKNYTSIGKMQLYANSI